MSVLVRGNADALALAGTDPGVTPPALVVALDDAPVPDAGLPVLRWWRTPPSGPAAAGERVAAPGGNGLAARAPWPVRDELFVMPPAAYRAVLVVEPDEPARAEAVAELEARGMIAVGAARLTVEDLAATDVVLHGVTGPGPLPGDAFAVLAARRILVTEADPAFGLVEGLEHFAAPYPRAGCDVARSVLAAPAAFEAHRRRGRLAAERHRASAVYARLVADL